MPANRTHVYYQLPMMLPAALVIAAAVESLWQQRLAGRAVLGALLLLHVVQTVRPLLKELFITDDRLGEGIELLRRRVPREATILSVDRHPALYSNSCHKGWFVREPELPAIERCLGRDVDYLLLTTPVRFRYSTEPPTWSRLNQLFTEVERTHHFSVWRRHTPDLRSDRGPQPGGAQPGGSP